MTHEEDWLSILEDLILHEGDNRKASIVNSTDLDVQSRYTHKTYLEGRVIMCPRDENVDEINTYILRQIPGEQVISQFTYNMQSNVNGGRLTYVVPS
uniref:ATP-dependent DNA helicase n=1 Tax=Triticum urartu TaxID=4572 RepID=A0A8R7TSV3_TRIUA